MSIPQVPRVPALALLIAFVLFPPQAAHAATIIVKAGDNLQAAIDAAAPGDTLLLAAGAVFTGNFVLPVKPGAAFITIRSDAGDSVLPSPGQRITPAYGPLLPKLISPNTAPALITAPGAHHWTLQFLEFPATRSGFGEILRIGDGSSAQNSLSMVPHDIVIDRVYIHGDPQIGQKRGIALNAAAVTIRNSYIAEIKGLGFDTQAIGGWNGPGPYVIENNYLEAAGENLLLGGADPAIANLVAQNVVVRYNHFSRPLTWRNPIVPTPTGLSAAPAGGGSLAAGTYSYVVVARRPVGSGATARSTASAVVSVTTPAAGAVQLTWSPVAGATEYRVHGRTASGLSQFWTVAGASFTDTGAAGQAGSAPTTIGDRWLVKNLFELKSARDVVVEYNLFENNWAHGQVGYAILFTPRNQSGGCPWCVVENVTFQGNVVRNVAGGISISGYDSPNPSLQTRGISIRHNLFYKVTTAFGGTGWFLLIGDEPRDIVVDHNTIDADGTAVVYAYGGTSGSPRQILGFQFTNNAARHNAYGIAGANSSPGIPALTAYFPNAVVTGNWLQGGSASKYPAGNYFSGTFDEAFADVAAGDYQAASGSVLDGRATDGVDIGADVPGVRQQTGAVTGGRLISGPSNLRIVR